MREIFQKVIPKMPFLPGHFFAEGSGISAQRICGFDAFHSLHPLSKGFSLWGKLPPAGGSVSYTHLVAVTGFEPVTLRV